MKKIIVLIIIFCFITACDKNEEKSKVFEIVEINGEVYTTEDLWNYSNTVLWQMEPKDLENEDIKSEILESFIQHVVLLQEAESPSVFPHLKIDQSKYEQLYLQLSTDRGSKELKALTGHYDIKGDNIVKLAYERMLVDALLQWLIREESIFIPEEDVKKLYDSKNLPKNPVGQAHILHIFSTDNDTIHLVAKELAAGIQFSELARRYSESPESASGGDLGFIKESNFPEFFSAAFRLKEGETSAIIKSDYGYHIFKMVQYAKASQNSYQVLKPLLLAELYANERNRLIGEYVNVLYSNANVKKLNNFSLADLFPADN